MLLGAEKRLNGHPEGAVGHVLDGLGHRFDAGEGEDADRYPAAHARELQRARAGGPAGPGHGPILTLIKSLIRLLQGLPIHPI